MCRSRVDLCLLLVAFSWGSTYLVAKELATGGVVALLAAKMLLAASALFVLVLLRRTRITRAEWRAGSVLGLLLAAVFTLETFGIALTSATNAGLIISLTIIITPLLDAALTRRRVSPRFLSACVIAVVGVMLLASRGGLQPPSAGDLLVLGAAGREMDPVRVTTVQMSMCAAVFGLASIVHGPAVPEYLMSLDVRETALFFYLVLVCTVLAFLIQTWAVARTSPSRVSLMLGTEPIWAVLIGVFLGAEAIGMFETAGVILILVGTGWGRTIDQGREVAETVSARQADRLRPSATRQTPEPFWPGDASPFR